MKTTIISIAARAPLTHEAHDQISWITTPECPDTYAVARAQNEEVGKFLSSGEGRAFLGNAFSLQMVAPNAIITVEECFPGDVPEEVVSVIGHADTAAVVSNLLGREVAFNRANVHLEDGDVLYVAQLQGGRLPEGATTLPDGFTLSFRRVTIRC